MDASPYGGDRHAGEEDMPYVEVAACWDKVPSCVAEVGAPWRHRVERGEASASWGTYGVVVVDTGVHLYRHCRGPGAGVEVLGWMSSWPWLRVSCW